MLSIWVSLTEKGCFSIFSYFYLNCFFSLYCFQSTRKKKPLLIIISSGFIQYIFQSISILIPLYMVLNLHYFWSALLEFSQYFKAPELLFNLWLNFNLNCFSITFFIFSFYCFSISTNFQSTLVELDFNLNFFFNHMYHFQSLLFFYVSWFSINAS